jgi:hypothetical protein
MDLGLSSEDLMDDMDIDLSSYFEADVGGTSASMPKGVSAEFLSKIWMIDLKQAEKTLEVTTQLM